MFIVVASAAIPFIVLPQSAVVIFKGQCSIAHLLEIFSECCLMAILPPHPERFASATPEDV